MAIGPSGWIRTTTSRVKNPACCVDTTEGCWTDGANGGIRTRTSRLGRPAGSRYPTFAPVRPLVSIVDTQAEHGPVAFTGPGTPVSCQRPHSLRAHWRQRQDSNPDPRGLEARMLPLHHAADVTSRLEPSRRQNLPETWRALPPSVRPKQKRPSRGSPQKACFSMSAEPLGRVASVGVIKHATGVAIDPRFGHGSRHTGGALHRAGQIKWPRWR